MESLNLEEIIINKEQINNNLQENDFYYKIYSDKCNHCLLLLKYLKYLTIKYKLIHYTQLEFLGNLDVKIELPLIINQKSQKININSLLHFLKEISNKEN